MARASEVERRGSPVPRLRPLSLRAPSPSAPRGGFPPQARRSRTRRPAQPGAARASRGARPAQSGDVCVHAPLLRPPPHGPVTTQGHDHLIARQSWSGTPPKTSPPHHPHGPPRRSQPRRARQSRAGTLRLPCATTRARRNGLAAGETKEYLGRQAAAAEAESPRGARNEMTWKKGTAGWKARWR